MAVPLPHGNGYREIYTPLPKMITQICTSLLSLPTRGVWIEIRLMGALIKAPPVTPHTGSVD